jgi:hypothetical protein
VSGFSPYGALHPGRIDQGVDFSGAGPVRAVLPGTVVSVGLWPGWPGAGGVVYRTDKGNVFVMEDFAPSVRPGQHVQAGQVIGHATGGSSGIETGWANSSGTRPLTPYNGAPDGTPMPGGRAFRQFLDDLASGRGVLGTVGGVVSDAAGAVAGAAGAVGGAVAGGAKDAAAGIARATGVGQKIKTAAATAAKAGELAAIA